MNKNIFAAALAALAALAVPSLMVPAAAKGSDQREARAYRVETTTIATLLDDPEASAILQRLIPTIFANEMFQTMGRPQTLRAIQQYEAAVLSDAKLKEIQSELDTLK